MTVRVVLEDLIEAVPRGARKPRFLTRERLLAFVTIASQILSFAVLRRPNLGPLHNALRTLLSPTGAAGGRDTQVPGDVVLQKIRVLRSRFQAAGDEEQPYIQGQIDALVDLLVQ